MSDPKTIYLQPECCADPETGRLWCEDDAPETCEDGVPWTKYVLASERQKRALHAITQADEDDVQQQAEPVGALRLFLGAAYPVSTDIDPRGYRWSETYLDQARAAALAAPPAVQVEPVSRKICHGIPRPGCHYMAECGTVCNKCGQIHSASLLINMADAAPPADDVPLYTISKDASGKVVVTTSTHSADPEKREHVHEIAKRLDMMHNAAATEAAALLREAYL